LQIRFCSKAKQNKTKQIHDEKEIKSCHQIKKKKKKKKKKKLKNIKKKKKKNNYSNS